jgi:hypothetical protein
MKLIIDIVGKENADELNIIKTYSNSKKVLILLILVASPSKGS